MITNNTVLIKNNFKRFTSICIQIIKRILYVIMFSFTVVL